MTRYGTGIAAAAALAGTMGLVGTDRGGTPLPSGPHFQLAVGESEPPEARRALSAEQLKELGHAVEQRPQGRQERLALVQGLEAAGRLDEAVEAAREWRRHDAYNLVVVRLLGDLYAESGNLTAARRTYSAVAELLPGDIAAQRALATVLKQSGDLEAARLSLLRCLRLGPGDRRIVFELADTEQRLGKVEEAAQRFQSLIDDLGTPDALRTPAAQRLAQIWSAQRRKAAAAADPAEARRLGDAIASLHLLGGVENDVKVYLTWDTDGTDVDLWLVTPEGEKVYYGHREGRHGEALFHDVTTGYGPESVAVPHAVAGIYEVQVHYYRGRTGAFSEARGEVSVILNEGREDESRQVVPYRLYEQGQRVTVARIQVR
jgi:tetratricopeptide (TPR) repeat protein